MNTIKGTQNVIEILGNAIRDLVIDKEFETAQELTQLMAVKIQNAMNLTGAETVTHEGRIFDVTHAVNLFVKEDKKIPAIKELRGITGMGLKEAKDFIEQPKYMDQHIKNFPNGYNAVNRERFQ